MKKLFLLLVVLFLAALAGAQTTPNFGFNVPPFNQQNWNTLENQNWFNLDSLLLTSGGTTLPTPSSSGLCFVSTGIIPGAWHWATCPGGGGGFVNPMTTLGDLIQASTGGTAVRLPGVTDHNGVPQVLMQIATGGVAAAAGYSPMGVQPNPQTGTSYTVLLTDRLHYLSFSNASAIAVTLPQAGSTGFDVNFGFVTCDIGAGTATITPTTSTVSVSTGTAYVSGATSLALTQGQCALVYSDNTNYFAIRLGAGGGSSGGAATALENCSPDQTGNSFYQVTSLTNWFSGHWEFATNTTTYVTCEVSIPSAVAGATLVLDIFSADTNTGRTANFQTCDNIISTGTLQVGTLTCAANQTFTTTGTAYQRVTLTFNVQTSLVSGGLLVVKIGTSPTGTASTNNYIVIPHFIL